MSEPQRAQRGTEGKRVEIGDWVELRDERGKLCGRLEVRVGLLEVRRNGASAVFDLAELLRGQISEF
jgi:hypothetical protein